MLGCCRHNVVTVTLVPEPYKKGAVCRDIHQHPLRDASISVDPSGNVWAVDQETSELVYINNHLPANMLTLAAAGHGAATTTCVAVRQARFCKPAALIHINLARPVVVVADTGNGCLRLINVNATFPEQSMVRLINVAALPPEAYALNYVAP